MARGWESKSVEDQVAAAETEKAHRAQPVISNEERERKARRDGLLLARARLTHDLEAASNPRHRAMLEHALRDLDEHIGGAA